MQQVEQLGDEETSADIRTMQGMSRDPEFQEEKSGEGDQPPPYYTPPVPEPQYPPYQPPTCPPCQTAAYPPYQPATYSAYQPPTYPPCQLPNYPPSQPPTYPPSQSTTYQPYQPGTYPPFQPTTVRPGLQQPLRYQPTTYALQPAYKDYMCWSIFTVFWCLPLGLCALRFSCKARSKIDCGDNAAAARHSHTACSINVTALMFGVFMYSAITMFIVFQKRTSRFSGF